MRRSALVIFKFAAKVAMQTTCLFQYCSLLLRFVRYKLYPFLCLTQSSIEWFSASGIERTRTENAWMISLSKVNMVNVYEFINDLLW